MNIWIKDKHYLDNCEELDFIHDTIYQTEHRKYLL